MAQASQSDAFETDAQDYDAWYDTPAGRALFASEVACVMSLLSEFPRPYLEIGVGTGRFARALGIEYGLDPSRNALALAQARSVAVVRGRGESLPFRDAAFGGALAAFTLCFVEDASRLLREARRVVAPGGGLVLGLLLRGTPWADAYAALGAAGHAIYRTARFSTRDEVEALLDETGFRITGYRSTLFQPPGQAVYHVEECRIGVLPGAGFTAIAATPRSPHGR